MRLHGQPSRRLTRHARRRRRRRATQPEPVTIDTLTTIPSPSLTAPVRWAAARDRATTAGIVVWQDQRTGRFFARSADGQAWYRVGWYDCACAAAQRGDPVCLHRAAFRQHCQDEDAAVLTHLRATGAA